MQGAEVNIPTQLMQKEKKKKRKKRRWVVSNEKCNLACWFDQALGVT